MTYVEKTLAPGEEIVAQARFNWTYSIEPCFWFLAGISPLLYALVQQALTGTALGDPAWLYSFCAVPAVLGFLLIVRHLIHMWTTEVVVTTSRMVLKLGLIARSTKEVSLNKIEEISLQQSILGRIFNYGMVTLRGTGVGVIELPNLNDPVELRRVMERAKAELRGTISRYDARQAASLGADDDD